MQRFLAGGHVGVDCPQVLLVLAHVVEVKLHLRLVLGDSRRRQANRTCRLPGVLVPTLRQEVRCGVPYHEMGVQFVMFPSSVFLLFASELVLEAVAAAPDGPGVVVL